MKRSKYKSKVMAEINIAPFTDVILVLLIIFMITTPMLTQPGIKVNLPKTQTTDHEDPKNIEILIDKEGFVYMEGKQIHDSNIDATIKSLILQSPEKPIVIKGDQDVRYDYVVQFMDKARKAGATRFALAVDNTVVKKDAAIKVTE
ncbi:MAG: biopolymer transporter ExbD [Endomicrobia bacterium]|nr:biopolymer transporter ExbD [Endomicrobiia bacterium]MCL2506501.1 biopolymer transporter ExbD [Endomicrobiia bacterium]